MDEEVVVALKRVAKGSLFVLIGFMILSIGTFLFRVLSARGLSVEEFGILSFLLSLIGFVTNVVVLGVPSSLPKFIVEYKIKGKRINELIGSAFLLTLSSSFLAFFLLSLAYPFVRIFVNVDVFTYLLFSFSVVLFAILATSVATDQGFGNYVVKAFFSDSLRGTLLGLGGLVVYLYGMLYSAGVTYFLSFLVASLSAFFYVYKKYRPVLSTAFLKELLVFSVPLLFATLFVKTMLSLDIIMLSYFLPEYVVGLYGSVQTLSLIGIYFHKGVGFLFFPFLASFFAKKMLSKADRFYKLVTKWVLALSLPLFSILFFYAPQVLTLVFGKQYSHASESLKILSLGYLVHVLLGANGSSLVALGYITELTASTALSLLLNVVLNLLLIPEFGIRGAAAATAISLILLNVFMSYILWKKTGIHPLYKKLFVPIVSSIIALFFTHALSFLPAFCQLAAFLLSYALLNVFLGVFDKEDVEIFKALKRKILS